MKILHLSIIIFSVLISFLIIMVTPVSAANLVIAESLGQGQLKHPLDVAVDKAGNIYVSDFGLHQIFKFGPDGKFVSKFGSYGTEDGQFRSPTGIALDDSGNIYVVDQGNGRIEEFDPSEKFLFKFGSGGQGYNQLNLAIGITVDNSKYVYVADLDNYRVQKIRFSDKFVSTFMSQDKGENSRFLPIDVALDNLGNVYVLDMGNARVQKFDSSGNLVLQFGSSGRESSQFYSPYGITIDRSGNIYVSDSGRIQKFDSSGKFLLQFGSTGSKQGQLDGAEGITVDNSGNVYVADSGNSRVEEFSPDGKFILEFGNSMNPSENKSQKQEAPLVISQVEIYGPTTSQEHSCTYDQSISAHQWFELYNPTNADVRIIGFDLAIGLASNNGFGSSETSDQQIIELSPHQKCIFGLFAPGQDVIPDPRNVVVKLGYRYNDTKYTISTPPLTDTYNDTRTWQLNDNGTWLFVAPSPREQLRSGITPEEIVCNQDLRLLINKATNMPACILPKHMTRLEAFGWIETIMPEYIPVLDRTYDSGPGFGCPFIFPHISILNSSGFETYNYSGIIHYTLKQGNHGAVVYNIYGDSYGLDPPIYSPNKVDIKNGVDTYFQPDSHHEIKQDTNSTIMVSFEPQSEIINYNGHVTVVVKISASSNASKGTYWLNIVPGGCSDIPPMPIVVGNKTDATDETDSK